MNDENNNNIIPSVTISKIVWNNGDEINLDQNDIVLFVGANNVGKSRTLKDIYNSLLDENYNKEVMIKKVEYRTSGFEFMRLYFEKNFVQYLLQDRNGFYIPINKGKSISFIYNDFINSTVNKKKFYPVLCSFLSTENRLKMTEQNSYSNQDKENLEIMTKFEENIDAINKINDILYPCFKGMIDVSDEVKFTTSYKTYKFGTKEEIEETIQLDRRTAVEKLKKLENLDEQGDGIRSAVAIISSFIAKNHSLYLIDEPETFLHPPQAKVLGSELVELSRDKQCLITTHNIDFIKGVLEKKSSRVKIIKINRENNHNDFLTINNESIMKIANDRNLKYSNILNGLFYNQVVLCENESDCKFYSTILEFLDNDLYQNTLFCSVGGKDQFKIIIPLLNDLHIKYYVIADLDLINDPGKLKSLLNSIKKDLYKDIETDHSEFIRLFKSGHSAMEKQEKIKEEILKLFTSDEYLPKENSDKIQKILKKSSNDFTLLKECGISCLSPECIGFFQKIVELLNKNNIFVVECGEIERFVQDVEFHGNTWVESVFEKYSSLEDPAYEDVKKFIKKIFDIK